MESKDALPWLNELIARAEARKDQGVQTGDGAQFNRQWAIEADAALKAIFPEGHSVLQGWAKSIGSYSGVSYREVTFNWPSAFAILGAAVSLIQAGRLGTLVDAIRSDADSELLDQAEILLSGDFRAAAAVIAGGALESHLRWYVAKNLVIMVNKVGSITNYNNAIGQHRKTNPMLYAANEGKLVEAWGGIRNDAAHSPGTFSRSKEDVERMIGGIREFIARTSS